MIITTLVPPAGEPVALAEARTFLRIDYEGEDELVASLTASGRARTEAETGLCLVTRTLRLAMARWPVRALESGRLELPVRPVSEVLSVTAAGADVTMGFALEAGTQPVLRPLSGGFPAAGDGVEITVAAGFGAPEDVPDELVLAVKMLAADAYAGREGDRVRGLSEDVAALLAPWRRVRL